MESTVERALTSLLDECSEFDYVAVKQLAAPETPKIPQLKVPTAPDLMVYDGLLSGGAR